MTTNENSVASPKYAPGQHPNSRKNLKPPWKPGENIPNKNGNSLSLDLRRALDEEAEFISPTARPKDLLWRHQMKRAILVGCARGEVPMINTFLDRTEGKVPGDQPPAANINVVFVIGKGYKDNLPQLKEG